MNSFSTFCGFIIVFFHDFLSIIALQESSMKEEIGKLSKVNNAECSLIEGKLFPLFYFFELQLGKCDF